MQGLLKTIGKFSISKWNICKLKLLTHPLCLHFVILWTHSERVKQQGTYRCVCEITCAILHIYDNSPPTTLSLSVHYGWTLKSGCSQLFNHMHHIYHGTAERPATRRRGVNSPTFCSLRSRWPTVTSAPPPHSTCPTGAQGCRATHTQNVNGNQNTHKHKTCQYLSRNFVPHSLQKNEISCIWGIVFVWI